MAAILAAVKKQAHTAREQIAAHVRADESLLCVFAVILPRPSAGTAWGDAAIVVPLVTIVSKVMWNRTAAAAQHKVGIGVRTRMVWALTDQRILLFSALKRWQLGEWLDEIPRVEVTSATAPTMGQGWRTVIIELRASRKLVIKVGPTLADDLAAELTPATPSGTNLDG